MEGGKMANMPAIDSAMDLRARMNRTEELMPKRMTVTFSVRLPYETKKDGGSFVAWCPPLDVYSMGYTPAEAKKNLAEAVRLFLTNCYDRGTLDAVLKSCGFRTFNPAHPPSRTIKRQRQIAVDLPFSIDGPSAPCHA
jgi:predicted RNase H-like HicB family nuclease